MLMTYQTKPGLGGHRRRSRYSSWLGLVGFWFERQRQRQALAGLSDDQLADIGLSRSDLMYEISKPFWR